MGISLAKIVFTMMIFLMGQFSVAHDVHRDASGPFEFPVEQNFSSLQKDDIDLLLQQLDLEFGSLIHNPSESWQSGFDWEKPYLGAGSVLFAGNFKVMLWGGMVRARFMTFGAVASLLCHELGHRLGGAPHQQFPGQSEDWSSSEGQADYFAATVCLPKIFDRLQKVAPQKLKQDTEPVTESLCRSSANPQRCQWVATSGIDMIQVLQVYYDYDIPFADPQSWSQERPVTTLLTQYPSYQCRMDTFKSGARDPKAPRLRCWYRP
jgi:hypothetical protein